MVTGLWLRPIARKAAQTVRFPGARRVPATSTSARHHTGRENNGAKGANSLIIAGGRVCIVASSCKSGNEHTLPPFILKRPKSSLATNLSDRITQHTVELLDDQRQFQQMLAVNNNLQAIETPQGHADSF